MSLTSYHTADQTDGRQGVPLYMPLVDQVRSLWFTYSSQQKFVFYRFVSLWFAVR